jgi:hypothetical protein
MDYFTSGNSYVDHGTYLVALGAFLTSLGWYLLAILKQSEKWLEKRFKEWLLFKTAPTIIMFLIISALIIYGLRMVGRGGTLTTKGWNMLDKYDQREVLVRALAQELVNNIWLLENPPMKRDVYYERINGKDDKNLILRPFPTLRTNTLNTILTSGLWDFGNLTEGEFLIDITNYEKRIGTANYHFHKYNDHLMSKTDPNEQINSGKELQRVIPEKEYFKSLNKSQSQVIKSILKEPRWGIKTKLPEVYNLFQEILQKESTAKKLEEGSSEKNRE